MGIRQTLNRNPVLSSSVAAVIVVIALAMQLKRGCSDSRSPVPQNQRKAFFTIDDGENWFPHDAGKVPPFKFEGKDAYRVAVFRCRNGPPFAARLERFSEPARKRLQDAVDHARGANERSPVGDGTFNPEMEIKRPGQKEWVRYTSKTMDEYGAVMEVRCLDGSMEGIEPVLAE